MSKGNYVLSLEGTNTVRNIAKMNKWNDLVKARMKELKMPQHELADALGVTQGAVAHWISGRREPSLEVIAKILTTVGLPPMGIAIPIYDQPLPPRLIESNAELIGEISGWDAGDPLDDDDCEVPYYDEVEFAGGNGMTEVIEIADRRLRFSNATLRAAGVDCRSAACARLRGRSMERLILDGATIGFDSDDTSIFDGEIYAFNHGGLLRVKYLFRLPGGAVRVHSENSDDFPDEIMTADQFRDEVKMLGRVFWWSTVRRSPRRK
jgi:phage repressor protein C with HTH and peptisase S24 domain